MLNASPPISCYIRTKNEESRIGDVIKAAFQVCSEVIVVDSESTDQTREIAESLGAKVILQPWLGNGHQKRIGEEAAENDWLLDLDADEVVSEALAAAIKKLFARGEDLDDIYSLKLVTIAPTGKVWHDSCLAWRNKLYRKSKFQMPAHKAWDQLAIPKGTKIQNLDGDLLHNSFENIAHLLTKMNRVSTVRANEKKLKPLWVVCLRIIFSFPLYFCKKYLKQGMFKEGIYGFSSAVIMASQRWLCDVKMYEIHKGLKK